MKVVITGLALICILFGLISMVTPIPGGTFLIAGGLTVLICTSPTAQYCLMWVRSRLNGVNSLMFWLERKVGVRVAVVGKALSKTHPPQAGTTVGHRAFVERNIYQNKAEDK